MGDLERRRRAVSRRAKRGPRTNPADPKPQKNQPNGRLFNGIKELVGGLGYGTAARTTLESQHVGNGDGRTVE